MTLWVPTDLASNAVHGWYFCRDAKGVLADGANITQAAGSVSSWANASGLAAPALPQSSGSLQPTYSANGLQTGNPGLIFSGIQYLYTTAFGYPFSDLINVFMVGSLAATGGNLRCVSIAQTGQSDAGANGILPFYETSTTTFLVYANGAGPTLTFANSTPTLFEEYAVDTSNYGGGVNGTQASGTVATYPSAITLDLFGLFADYNAGVSGSGTCSELLIVRGLLSSADLARIEGYLAWNNGIQGSLPSGHAYASAAPTVSGGAVNGSASGDTVSVAQSVIAGSATGGAAIGGATIAITGAVLAGSASGAASAAGTFFTLTDSLLGGTAIGSALANGAVIAFTQSFIAGTATGSSVGNAPGTTISVTASLAGGTATGNAAASGGALSLAPSLIAGAATVSVDAPGSLFGLTPSIIPGAALGGAGGALLSVTTSLVSGSAQGGALASGTLWTLPYAFVPGAALRVDQGPSSRPITLLGSARVITLLGSSRVITLDRKVSMKQDIAQKIGTTWTFKDCVARDSEGNAVDITGATIEFRIVKAGVLLLKLTSGLGDFTITDGPNGKYSGNLPYTDARHSSLLEGTFSYELDIISSAGGLTDQNYGKVTLANSFHFSNP